MIKEVNENDKQAQLYAEFHSDLVPLVSMFSSVRYGELNFSISSVNNNGELENKEFKVKQSGLFQHVISVRYQRRIEKASNHKCRLYLGGEFKNYFHLSFTPAARFVMNEIGINPKLTIIRNIGVSSIKNPSTGNYSNNSGTIQCGTSHREVVNELEPFIRKALNS